MHNPYFVLKISWYAGLFIVIGNSFYVEIYIRKKYTFKILGLESEFEFYKKIIKTKYNRKKI